MKTNLFVKIFLGFWLVITLVLGSWLLTARYFEDLPRLGPQANTQQKGPPPRFMLRLMYALQTEPIDAIPGIIEDTRRKHNMDVYIVNAQREELYDRKLPPGADKVLQRLEDGIRRASISTPDGRIFGHGYFRPDSGRLSLVLVPPPASTLVDLLTHNLWLRVALALLVSGLVCYLLSRLMTGRLQELRLASRELAGGDLDARIAVREHGGDETDELARDFNSMAGQLAQTIQSQKRLLSDVSHELRSPLARLRLALALAERSPQQAQSYMQRIEREAERLEELIAQLLSVPEGQPLLEDPVDLVALLDELSADAAFEAVDSNKQVVFETGLSAAPVDSHADLLRKCFENILRNAVRYTRPGTAVTIRLAIEGSEYHIDIADHGPGVPEPDLPNLFTEFYRTDSARARESGGYGLGLAIARRAVQRHNGRISANNTDHGLQVNVCLPQG